MLIVSWYFPGAPAAVAKRCAADESGSMMTSMSTAHTLSSASVYGDAGCSGAIAMRYDADVYR